MLGYRGGLAVALPPLLGQLGPNAVTDVVNLICCPVKEGKGQLLEDGVAVPGGDTGLAFKALRVAARPLDRELDHAASTVAVVSDRHSWA